MKLTSKWRKTNDWVLERVTRPPAFGRSLARSIIVIIVILIGMVDYLAGIRISLGAFYFVPIALAVSWLGWEEAVFMALFSTLVRIVGDYAAIAEQPLPLWSWWNSTAALTVYMLFIWIFNALITLHRQLESRVEERTADLVEAAEARRQLEGELLQVGARERNAFGQELHDDICQHLVGTAFAAKVLTQNLATQSSPLTAEAQAIVNWLEEGAHKARQLARGLLLAEIDPEKLGEKLTELVEECSHESRHGRVICRFRQEGNIRLPEAGTAGQLFRIAQEAVRNALKHADARHIDVALVGDANAVCLIVEDDGGGLPALDASNQGMGLRIMAHRAGYIGGKLTVMPASGQGTRVLCYLPRMEQRMERRREPRRERPTTHQAASPSTGAQPNAQPTTHQTETT